MFFTFFPIVVLKMKNPRNLKTNILSFILCVLLLMTLVPSQAFAEKEDNVNDLFTVTLPNGELLPTAIKEIGKYDKLGGKAYLISVPYGCSYINIKENSPSKSEYAYSSYTRKDADKLEDGSYNINLFISPDDLKDNILLTKSKSFRCAKNEGFDYFKTQGKANFYLDNNITLPKENVQGFYIFLGLKPRPAFIIQQSTVQSGSIGDDSEARKELKETIASVTGENGNNYYQENDRYNGKESDTIKNKESGFWKEFTEPLGTLQRATAISKDNGVNDEYIKKTTETLNKEIAKLIPKKYVNATALYETVQYPPKVQKENDWVYGTSEDYTVATWNVYINKKEEGKELLHSLYNDDGSPSEKNKSNNEELKAEIQNKTQNILDAIEALDLKGDKDDSKDVEMAYKNIYFLANNLFNSDKMNASDYTEESYKAFIGARDKALEWYSSHNGSGEDPGQKQTKEYLAANNTFWTACYKGLVSSKNTAEVSVTIVDNYPILRKKGEPLNCVGTYKTVLNGDLTVNAALGTQRLEAITHHNRYDGAVGVYLNGIFLQNPDASIRTAPQSNLYNCSDIHLKDGDKLVVVLMAPPTYSNLSGSIGFSPISEVGEYVKYQQITQEGKVVDSIETAAGEDFILSVNCQRALPFLYDGRTSALEGAEVYVSRCCEKEEVARTAATVVNTNVVTTADGSARVALYKEGWYALNVFGKEKNSGLSNGSIVIVHVNSAKDESAVKEKLKTGLDKVYNKLDENSFSSEDWKRIKAAYDIGVEGIKNAATIGETKEICDKATSDIQKIRDASIKDNDEKLADFRSVLNRLPDDETKVGSSLNPLIEGNKYSKGLIGRYEALNDYQRSRLSGIELEKYNRIITVYNNGLKELEPYKLKLEVKGDSEDATVALNDMINYLKKNGYHGIEDKDKIAAFSTCERYPNYLLQYFSNGEFGFTKDTYKGSDNKNDQEASYPDRRVRISYDVGPSAYFLLQDAENHILSGENWSISQENFKVDDEFETYSSAAGGTEYYTVLKNVTVKINGQEYEIKSIKLEGAEKSYDDYIAVERDFDLGGYMGKRPMIYLKAGCVFAMPYKDVTVTIKWGPVGGTSEEINAAKEAAKQVVQAAYDGYSEANYTAENWQKLTDIKNQALLDIENAADNKVVSEARKTALAAMEAVPLRDVPVPVPNVPSFGKNVGSVYVSVENTTFKGGAFTGTILNGKYDLCEDDTMMTVVLKALAAKGYSWKGTGGKKDDPYSISYLASINKESKALGEFSGERGSGWMGTLNDWFVNEGFNEFSVKGGKLENGDEIKVLFTQNLGEDIGGTWGNSDTSLANLKISGGELMPKFSSDTTNYGLIISDSGSSLQVTPTASNKNYLVKTFLNDYNKDSGFFKRRENLPVKSGDVIYIGVGEKGWPSMNSQGAEARAYTATKYTVNVYGSKGDYVKKAIDELPTALKLTLADKSMVESLRKFFESLSSKEKEKVTNLNVLKEAEERIKFLDEIQNVKKLLEAIPYVTKITLADKSTVMKADAAYKALTDKQKLYITIGDVTNYNAAVDKLIAMGAFSSGDAPSKIKGNEEAPEDIMGEKGYVVREKIEVTAKADNTGKALATVTAKDMTNIIKKALEDVKNAEEKGKKNVTIELEIAVKTDEKATAVETNVPTSSINEIVKNNGSVLLSTSVGNLNFDAVALKALSSQSAGSEVTFNIEKVDNSKDKIISGIAALNTRPVFKLEVASNKKAITNFKEGKILISLPYTLRKSEREAGLKIVYIDEKGTLNLLAGSEYNADKKSVEGETNHFSYYGILYQALAFADIKNSDWYYDSVMYLANNNIVKGTSENTFGPKNSITRAEFVQILYNKNGKPEISGESKFTDVKKSDWYANAVIWATEQGIVSGTINTDKTGIFNPNEKISRQDMAVILSNYLEKAEKKTLTSKNEKVDFLDDQKISSYAKNSVIKMQSGGIINGVKNGGGYSFNPKDNATRAEAASMLAKLFQTK